MIVMKCTVYLMCLCFIGWKQVDGVSLNLLRFLSYVNGDWNNTAQVKDGGYKHDLLQIRLVPVNLSIFPDPVVFVEDGVNGDVRILQLGVITDSGNNSVSMKLYNLPDFTKYKAGGYDIGNLSNITLEDLQSDDGCAASFRIMGDDFIAGIFPHCGYNFNGTHPLFSVTFTCDVFTYAVPINVKQTASIDPYILQLIGPKYPLSNPPDDFVSPCAGKVKTT